MIYRRTDSWASDMPGSYSLPAEIRDALLRYLVTRPYGEVADGVQALMSLRPLTEPPPGEPNDTDGP
jgi:hypothetical protein